ncbi:MAG TPA: tetratricopeptide repeat protein [Candidatus Obscuribacterales bacterium]
MKRLKTTGQLYDPEAEYCDEERELRRYLARQERLLGPTHLDLAPDLYRLGILCFKLDKYAAAEALLLRALEIQQNSSGPADPDVRDSTIAREFLQLLKINA